MRHHSARLYDFLQRKVGDVSDINMQIEAKNMFSRHSVRTINVTSSLDLKGAVLDNFYDVWEGQSAEYQDKTNGVASKETPVSHRDIRLSLTCDRLSDAKGVFSGIAVYGLIPVLLHGSGSHRYTLNADGLSRITKKEQEIIKPFYAVADSSGYFRFQVGLPNLQEFYYRVVPTFLENPSVDFTDNCEKEAEGYLPPEPAFDFYLDCETPDLFRKFTVTPVSKVKVGVSVESGILDLSLTSSGISEEELLEVLQSYRQRKRFHVLSSGIFWIWQRMISFLRSASLCRSWI